MTSGYSSYVLRENSFGVLQNEVPYQTLRHCSSRMNHKIVPGGGAIGKREEKNGDENIEQTKLRLKEARKRTKGYLNISHVFFLGSRRIIREGSST